MMAMAGLAVCKRAFFFTPSLSSPSPLFSLPSSSPSPSLLPFSRISFIRSTSKSLRRRCLSTDTAPQHEQKPPGIAEEPEQEFSVDNLDFRVGRILKAWKHPEADSLFVEEVDVGEPSGPRTICSGLVGYVPQEELQDRGVIVLANLKPRNMRGIKSNGMLLAASDAAHETVELLSPPQTSTPGERVWFGIDSDRENQSDPATPNQLQKKKIWEALQSQLKTTDECVASFNGRSMRTLDGPVTCKSLKCANIA